ncbi:dihydroneopterin aldolase [uncultured Sphingomonas sp.]|uniref:dihydroneopterin aldolase n=1 Tax=uncultured Sphingomonas sp. TaxID=158754 RepID=UPI0025CE44E7|nr:dihydroneopterin aldolase [uncultured Sphingomonas sp.]
MASVRYVIRLENCAFFARHGVFDEEERLGQRFYVDAQVQVDAALGDDGCGIVGTVDYGALFAEIERLVRGRRHLLIESLALEIARELCDRFPAVAGAVIRLRKPCVPIDGILDHVEVEVAWPPADAITAADATVSRSQGAGDAPVLFSADRV